MPTRTSECVVVRDSTATLWAAVAEGAVGSKDLSPDGKLRPSFGGPQKPSTKEAARLRQGLPFAKQQPPSISPPKPPGVLDLTLQLELLKRELRSEEVKRLASEKRERALIKVVGGLCEFKAAR